MNASKLTVWKDFKAEVNTIKRTQANISPLPMDLGAFLKGKNKGAWEKGKRKGGKDAKGKGKKGCCFLCGSPDHMQAQCPKGNGKGKGGKGKGTGAKGKTQCHKCWGYGHIAANCPSQSLNSFETGSEQQPQQQQGDDTWWWWSPWSVPDYQQWWADPSAASSSTAATGPAPGAGVPVAPGAAQTLNALKLNTLGLDGLSLNSLGSSELKLKVDSAAGASAVPVGASQEPVQQDDKSGRLYECLCFDLWVALPTHYSSTTQVTLSLSSGEAE
eukprot:3499516-Amphidinium_carterae.2